MFKRINLILIIILGVLLLIPGITFAAQTDRNASQVIVSNINAEADGQEKVVVDIYLQDGLNQATKGTVFMGTQRGSVDQFWLKEGNRWVRVASLSKAAGDKVYYLDGNIIQAEIDGHIQLGISSKVKGTAEIGVGLKGERELRQYLAGNATMALAEIIPVKYEERGPIEDKKYNQLALEPEENLKTLSDNKIYLKILENNKNTKKLGEEIKEIDLELTIVDKPARSGEILLKKSLNFTEELREEGTTYLTFNGDTPGDYQVKIVAKLKYQNSFMPTTTLEETVVVELEPKVFGANRIELFIDSPVSVVDGEQRTLEVAPFIQEGRTFVPVRFIGEALGAEVEWQPETQVIVLSRPDKKITMIIGTNAIATNTGEVYISDVAPFLKDNYTFLPFRIIAEAFGAEVEAVSQEDGKIEKVIFKNE